MIELGLEVKTLKEPMYVSSPLGTRARIGMLCRGCELEISGILLTVDLRVMDMSEFDVILGMDWLTAYRVLIDCECRRLPPTHRMVLVLRFRGISTMLFPIPCTILDGTDSWRSCRSPICWTEVRESFITGPDLIRDTSEKVSLIRQRLLTAQSRQKRYADQRRRPLEFEVGDHVFLKVMPKRGVVRFSKRGKLSPRFIRPFEILERVGIVAYRLALPPSMAGVHEVFHVSMLRKYTQDPAHVVD